MIEWYVSLKGYYEFDAQNRSEGRNLWATLVIPLKLRDTT